MSSRATWKMTMNESGWRTSFFGLTVHGQVADPLAIQRIEVPIFQRDYAQGRQSGPVERIRTDFLEVLHAAITSEDQGSVGLDFVYGEVRDGTLQPLDGQQRLTTLFLLHWYLASRSDHVPRERGWTQFAYATRQSAEMFCESLADEPLSRSATQPSRWIRDQPWYQFLWRHDPTIQSMLVMLDAIHDRFSSIDATQAFERLTDRGNPAVWFLLLPLSFLAAGGEGATGAEGLYIKMNSRGKPLTPFETFKAHFEKTIQWSPRASEFALKADTDWSDLLWSLRGDDDLIDGEFMHLLEFITEVCEWREGRADGAGADLRLRAQAVFGVGNPDREAHLEFLFRALDVWVGRSISETFEEFFALGDAPDDSASRIRLFFRQDSAEGGPTTLFEACCRSYGEIQGGSRNRVFSAGQALMLYAVFLHLLEGTDEFPRRARMLRNLIEASSSELRFDDMPSILEDVDQLILTGSVASVHELNRAQREDEALKEAFLQEHPGLTDSVFRLEDHVLLRGSLGAFELDPATFEARAKEFRRLMASPDLWADVLGALLAFGPYQRQRGNARPFFFGTSSKRHENAWRLLLTGGFRDALRPTRQVLGAFLDRVAGSPAEVGDTLKNIAADYLAECEEEGRFDWRYYMVKYPAMRENGSSTYFAEPDEASGHVEMGYSLCMLQAGGKQVSGHYRDPYLLALARELDSPEVVEDRWFTGYETEPRWLPLTRSGTAIRCVPRGYELSPPAHVFRNEFAAACESLGVGEDNLVPLPQVEEDGKRYDTVDRVKAGAKLLQDLASAGL